jgi:hypothetical protein
MRMIAWKERWKDDIYDDDTTDITMFDDYTN